MSRYCVKINYAMNFNCVNWCKSVLKNKNMKCPRGITIYKLRKIFKAQRNKQRQN